MDKAGFVLASAESCHLPAFPAQHCGTGPNIHTVIKLPDELPWDNQAQAHR